MICVVSKPAPTASQVSNPVMVLVTLASRMGVKGRWLKTMSPSQLTAMAVRDFIVCTWRRVGEAPQEEAPATAEPALGTWWLELSSNPSSVGLWAWGL
jgi:hypothetical protein